MDYYSLFEIPTNATPDVIKTAYEIAGILHENEESEEEHRQREEAYNVLIDTEKRIQYNEELLAKGQPLPTKTVIVFGETKAGKTSMLNALLNRNNPTSNQAIGCTVRSSRQTALLNGPVQLPAEAKDYIFWDTAGLNETEKGGVADDQAILKLTQLLQVTKGGINLLIFVARLGAVTNTMKHNYTLFVETITKRKIPVLLVVTGCENCDEDWAEHNARFYEGNGMTFARIIDACFAKGGKLEPSYRLLREESARRTWAAILEHASEQPIDFLAGDGIEGVLMAIRAFVTMISPMDLINYFNGQLYRVLVSTGMEPDIANRIACPIDLHDRSMNRT